MAAPIAIRSSLVAALALLAGIAALALPAGAAAGGGRLDAALDRVIEDPQGPPGLSVLIQRGRHVDFRSRGVANRKTGAKPKRNSPMRIASMAKAFNGAVALSLVSEKRLGLDDTAGQWLPGVWPKADAVTVREMLGHTAGLPDYIRQPAFVADLTSDPAQYMTPLELIDYVNDLDVGLPPGESYEYSDSDNIMVGLIAEAATGRPYEKLLANEIYKPVGIRDTSLPDTLAMPKGYMHGYDRNDEGKFEDVSKFINPALAWASGGIVSTPADVNRFFRAYVGGDLFSAKVARSQNAFVHGLSSPPGPGRNDATLALFRYRTRCGTVYGHTGSYPGYRLFAASSANGKRSVVFSVNSQIVPGQGSPRVSGLIRRAQADAVCLALR
ncbi:MAG: serine hydrolase domain-containing protein [Solirubrobacterales bacterium]